MAACYVRVLNELPAAVQLPQLAAPVLPSTPSPYTAGLCGLPLLFSNGANVTVSPTPASAHYSILLYGSGNGTSAVLADPDAAVGDTGDGSIDQVTLTVINALPYRADLYGGPSECYNCALPLLSGHGGVAQGGAFTTPLLAQYDYFNLRPWDHALGTPPQVTSLPQAGRAGTAQLATLREHGVYTLLLHADGSASLLEDVAGRNAYLPILYAALWLCALGVAHWLAGRAYAAYHAERPAPAAPPKGEVTLATFFGFHKVLARRAAARARKEGGGGEPEEGGGGSGGLGERLMGASLQLQESEVVAAAAPPPPRAAAAKAKPERVLSLDTFRGFALCFMLFANFGGGRYWFFDHARWNGLTVADLLFPWFVFMSGVSAAMSFASERRRGATAGALALKSCVRCLKLLGLGLFVVNSPTYLPGMRAFSVLSYFGVSYLCIGLVDALVPVLGGGEPAAAGGGGGGSEGQQSAPAPPSLAAALYTDFGRYALQWGVMGAVAAVYLLLRFFLPVPGCPTGYAGPGGLADQGAYPASCVGGAAGYLSVQLFGAKHSYAGATCKDTYNCGPYDPEGSLGALMAAWMAWLGLSAGRMLEAARARAGAGAGSARAVAPQITARWVAMGLLLCLGAGVLCGCAWRRGAGARARACSASFAPLLPPSAPAHTPSFLCLASPPPPPPPVPLLTYPPARSQEGGRLHPRVQEPVEPVLHPAAGGLWAPEPGAAV